MIFSRIAPITGSGKVIGRFPHNSHVTDLFINPRWAGARRRTRRAGGVLTPPLTRSLGQVATRGSGIRKSAKNIETTFAIF